MRKRVVTQTVETVPDTEVHEVTVERRQNLGDAVVQAATGEAPVTKTTQQTVVQQPTRTTVVKEDTGSNLGEQISKLADG